MVEEVEDIVADHDQTRVLVVVLGVDRSLVQGVGLRDHDLGQGHSRDPGVGLDLGHLQKVLDLQRLRSQEEKKATDTKKIIGRHIVLFRFISIRFSFLLYSVMYLILNVQHNPLMLTTFRPNERYNRQNSHNRKEFQSNSKQRHGSMFSNEQQQRYEELERKRLQERERRDRERNEASGRDRERERDRRERRQEMRDHQQNNDRPSDSRQRV